MVQERSAVEAAGKLRAMLGKAMLTMVASSIPMKGAMAVTATTLVLRLVPSLVLIARPSVASYNGDPEALLAHRRSEWVHSAVHRGTSGCAAIAQARQVTRQLDASIPSLTAKGELATNWRVTSRPASSSAGSLMGDPLP